MGIEQVLGKKRASLVILHPTSLPDPARAEYGIGELGSEAYRFVDFLAKAGILAWQILPFGHTGFRDSPYQTSSRFAGSPYWISIERLLLAGDLTRREHDAYVARVREANLPVDRADFGFLFRNKVGKNWDDADAVLRQAYVRFNKRGSRDTRRLACDAFRESSGHWLQDYAEYMAIKEHHGHRAWAKWRGEFRDVAKWRAKRRELLKKTANLAKTIDYYAYLQFVFFEQWEALRKHARRKGRVLIGDIPWYVGYDSADVWANRDIFDLDSRGLPRQVAGVPPDYFSRTGQLWGNPLYAWENPRTLEWWAEAIEFILTKIDILRMDHFRAIDSYWRIPYEWALKKKTASKGDWAKGPGAALLRAIRARLGARASGGVLPIIAEDLGFLDPVAASPAEYPKGTADAQRYKVDPAFRKLLLSHSESVRAGLDRRTGVYNTRKGVDAVLREFDLAWMGVLQFGFEGDRRHQAQRMPPNSVIYTGTHDNDTAVGWYAEMVSKENMGARDPVGNLVVGASAFDKAMLNFARRRPRAPQRGVSLDMIEAAYSSASCLAGAPMQDYLRLGREARMNQPGDIGKPWWGWRATCEEMDYAALARLLSGLNRAYRRSG